MRKTKNELELLNTQRLLRYYKAERKRYDVAKSSYYWGIDHVEFMWDVHETGYEKEKAEYEEWQAYLNLIKTVLDNREHLEKK